MNKYIKLQFEIYPELEIQDYIKFLYQSILGSAHLIANQQANYERLLAEYQQIQYDSNHLLYEEISDTLVRVHLEALPSTCLPEVHKLFMKSIDMNPDLEIFIEELMNSEKMIEEKKLPFELKDWKEYLTDYQKKGYPAVSHSESFRMKYHPHYRLMKKEYIDELKSLLI